MRLPFTYDPPSSLQIPMWHEGIAVWAPCAIVWQPTIYSSAAIAKHGHTLSGKPEIPWQYNIQEIYVESRRAYAALDQITPADRVPVVRLRPPVPNTDHIKHTPPLHDIACFCLPVPEDIKLAGGILAGIDAAGCIFVQRWRSEEFGRATIVIFPNWEIASARHLQLAIQSGARVISSDAGAAQEYLTHFARPGTWHVVHAWDAGHYIEAIKDLLGQDNAVTQSDYIDQVPYLPAVGKGDGQ